MAEKRVELAVVGGGLNGLTLGIACASAGLKVLVIDREDPATMMGEQFDGRTSAIAYGSMRVLDGIGVWPILAAKAEAIREIRVADNSAPLFLHYDHREIGDEPMGWIVENRDLRRALHDRARQLPNLELIAPMQVQSGTDGVITLGNGNIVRAELIAAADGKNSPLREAAGIKSVTWSYPQIGIVATVRHAKPHRGVAVEHFLPAGPFAILPMTGNRSSIVWTERATLAPNILKLDDAAFHAELASRFGDFLGDISVEGPRWSYKLSFLHAQTYVAPRLVLVGEAAHVIHPIAGQGLNMGIRDTAALAECLIDGRRLGLDLGDGTVLARYERWRRFDNIALAAVTDGLNRLFSNSVPPLKLARDVGLAAVGQAPPLKHFFMRHAMGTVGDLPRLVRGEPL
ncbi:MAG TPA: UbiH/UbiF/VisC/COQ6 family ubiquinone biosynthesis hydroxylase [Stellaceae bacterium]|jgi:2-octaprenyl-6-methoxyphenol hydroxylase